MTTSARCLASESGRAVATVSGDAVDAHCANSPSCDGELIRDHLHSSPFQSRSRSVIAALVRFAQLTRGIQMKSYRCTVTCIGQFVSDVTIGEPRSARRCIEREGRQVEPSGRMIMPNCARLNWQGATCSSARDSSISFVLDAASVIASKTAELAWSFGHIRDATTRARNGAAMRTHLNALRSRTARTGTAIKIAACTQHCCSMVPGTRATDTCGRRHELVHRCCESTTMGAHPRTSTDLPHPQFRDVRDLFAVEAWGCPHSAGDIPPGTSTALALTLGEDRPVESSNYRGL